MPETTSPNLSGVAETLLMTLYIRAMESQRPDALIKDEKAVALVTQMRSDVSIRYDFDRVRQVHMDEEDKVTVILRNREFDRYARDFLARHPEAVVVHIGCGLDSRFERVDNGEVEWYDLDLPNVIELRRKLIGDEGKRYHLLGCSAFDSSWLDAVSAHRQRPFLFLAEGVLMYFEEAQVKSLVLMLRDHFPGAELVIDAFSPFIVRANNLRLSITKFGARYHWGLKRGQELEGWGAASPTGAGIRLLDEWGYFDRPEPRLDHIRWMRHIPLLAKVLRIYHFQLGTAAG
jgi:methyltransferase (TIGR00027 family)